MERHYTDHNQPWAHTYPHDHIIEWSPNDGHPILGDPINYPSGDVPEFKGKVRTDGMNESKQKNSVTILPDGSSDFASISDFKQSLYWDLEAEFEWKGKLYGVVRYERHDLGI